MPKDRAAYHHIKRATSGLEDAFPRLVKTIPEAYSVPEDEVVDESTECRDSDYDDDKDEDEDDDDDDDDDDVSSK